MKSQSNSFQKLAVPAHAGQIPNLHRGTSFHQFRKENLSYAGNTNEKIRIHSQKNSVPDVFENEIPTSPRNIRRCVSYVPQMITDPHGHSYETISAGSSYQTLKSVSNNLLNVTGSTILGVTLMNGPGLSDTISKNTGNLIATNPHHLAMIRHLHGTKVNPYNLGKQNELQDLLKNIDEWHGIDIRNIQKASNNHPLSVVTWAVMEKRNLFNLFELDKKKMLSYLLHVEDSYHDRPYHNRLHAADVVHSVHVLLNTPNIKSCFSDLEMFKISVSESKSPCVFCAPCAQYPAKSPSKSLELGKKF